MVAEEAEEAEAGAVVALTAYVRPLTVVSSFKYLGRVLVASDNDYPTVIRKLRRSRHKWAILSQVFGR